MLSRLPSFNWLCCNIYWNAWFKSSSVSSFFKLLAPHYCQSVDRNIIKCCYDICTWPYARRNLDKQISKDCGNVSLLKPEDDATVYRRFDMKGHFPIGFMLNIPPPILFYLFKLPSKVYVWVLRIVYFGYLFVYFLYSVDIYHKNIFS